jgi:TPR repeat protein
LATPPALSTSQLLYRNLGRHVDAVRWYRRALDAGYQSAHLELARAELYGVGTRRNLPSALARLERVAEGIAYAAPIEQTEAMLLMADALRNGWLLRRDYQSALRLLRRAARLGCEAAKGMLSDEGLEAP